jgi:DNA-binding SARP family transcriptional activator
VLGEALLVSVPPFADLAGEPSLEPEVDRLEELLVSVLEDRITAELTSGRDAQLVGELEALTAAHPLRERLWGHLVLALYRSGHAKDSWPRRMLWPVSIPACDNA